MGHKNKSRKRNKGKPTHKGAASSGKQAQAQTPPPTPSQRLESAAQSLASLDSLHGPPPMEGVEVDPPRESGEALRQLEELLVKAKAHYEQARNLEEAARKASEEAARKREDEEAALQRKHQEADEREQELQERTEALERRQGELERWEAELREREAENAERTALLSELELEAEQGFRKKKAEILGSIQEELDHLRERREQLEREIARREEEAEQRLRDLEEEWSQKRREEEARRSRLFHEEHLRMEKELAEERRRRLELLRKELADERSLAEQAWEQERARREEALARRKAELDERERSLVEKERQLRQREAEIETEKALLEEDRAALDRKVQRLVQQSTENLRHELEALRQQLTDARSQRDRYFQDLEARRELDRRLGERRPEELLSELERLERERDELDAQLRERPDVRAAERLAELERERSQWLEERATLLAELAQIKAELQNRRLAAIELESLRKQKEALETHKQLLDAAVGELQAQVEELTRQEALRNPLTALSKLDKNEELQTPARTVGPLSRSTPDLAEFLTDLRHRIARGIPHRRLYYSEATLRAWLGGLAMSRLILLQGISGTGKTSLPIAFADAVGAGLEVIEVQAGWRDRQDLIGYYNAFHRHYYATDFLQALYRAGTPAYRDRLFIIVLDEINLSRPEQFFADFLSALEQPEDKQRLTLLDDPVPNPPLLMKDGRHLPIPPNVWFVGTANHDETTTDFADKTYDRAHVMEMPRHTSDSRFEIKERPHRAPLSFPELRAAFEGAAEKHRASVERAHHWLREAPFSQMLAQRFRVGWGNRLENQLARYLPVVVESGGTVGEAVDHLLATKLLRKLRDRHDLRASDLEKLQEQIMTDWMELDEDFLPEQCTSLLEDEISIKRGEQIE